MSESKPIDMTTDKDGHVNIHEGGEFVKIGDKTYRKGEEPKAAELPPAKETKALNPAKTEKSE